MVKKFVKISIEIIDKFHFLLYHSNQYTRYIYTWYVVFLSSQN